MSLIFEGAIACKAVILKNKREVEKLVVDYKRNDKDTRYIIAKAHERNIPVEKVESAFFDEIATGKTHGGIVCYAKERIYDHMADIAKGQTIFILEGIEDPFNFAHALRAIYASGADGVLVSERNWTSVDNVLAKASAGASEYLPIVMCKDFDEGIRELKQQGFKLACCIRSDESKDYTSHNFLEKQIIAIGGEMRGLSKAVLNHMDYPIHITYGNDFRNSLSANMASAIIAFEALRQKNL